MSIEYRSSGNIVDDPSDILVCAVNCVPGVMGKGQAFAFRKRWPTLPVAHKEAVARYGLRPGFGSLYWMNDCRQGVPKFHRGVYLFPTKDHWSDPSRLEWIAEGLRSLVKDVAETKKERDDHHAVCIFPDCDVSHIRSIAVPALGCGNGGLSWRHVRPLIDLAELKLPSLSWTIYEPGSETR